MSEVVLYVVARSGFGTDVAGVLMTAEGVVIYSHMSSSMDWLEADLTRNFRRAGELAIRFPDGYQIQRVGLDDPLPDVLAPYFATGEAEVEEPADA